MPSVIEISSWDVIQTKSGHVVVILPPIPQPRGILIAADGVYVVTMGHPVRLHSSFHMRGVVGKALLVVVAEAHECIVRETLVPTAWSDIHLDGEEIDELAAA